MAAALLKIHLYKESCHWGLATGERGKARYSDGDGEGRGEDTAMPCAHVGDYLTGWEAEEHLAGSLLLRGATCMMVMQSDIMAAACLVVVVEHLLWCWRPAETKTIHQSLHYPNYTQAESRCDSVQEKGDDGN